jgi:hypothetical protein
MSSSQSGHRWFKVKIRPDLLQLLFSRDCHGSIRFYPLAIKPENSGGYCAFDAVHIQQEELLVQLNANETDRNLKDDSAQTGAVRLCCGDPTRGQ